MNRSILFLKKLARPVDLALTQIQNRFRRSRGGSVLIMVVALLVLLALMGTAYMATARLDRQGSVPLTTASLIDDTLTELLQGQMDEVQRRISTDTEFQTGHNSPADALRYVGAREPGFMPIYVPPGSTLPTAAGYDGYLNWPAWTLPKGPKGFSVNPNPLPALGHVPAWSAISRPLPTVKFNSPYNPKNLNAPYVQWDADDVKYWLVPRNVAILYPNSGVSDELLGRTRVYPAFDRYYYFFDPTTNRPVLQIDSNGPYLAADSTGWGIADSGLVQINSTPIDGITYYSSMRVVDNAAGLNVNVHWGPDSDATAAGADPYNFFPPVVDLRGFLQNTTATREMENGGNGYPSVVEQWLQGAGSPAVSLTPYADPIPSGGAVVQRNDFTFRTAADALWNQNGARLDYTGYLSTTKTQRFGSSLTIGTRAFGADDQSALAYRGVMSNPDNTRSNLEATFFNVVNGTNPPVPAFADSLYALSMNYVDQSTNKFRFVTARDVNYWFDANYNSEGVTDVEWGKAPNTFPAPFNPSPGSLPAGIGNKLGKNARANPKLMFRSPRPLLVASNPVSNRADASVAAMNQLTKTYGANFVKPPVYPPVAAAVSTMTAYTAAGYTPKVSLNTAQFGDLWRGYFFTMIDNSLPAPVGEPFKVPGTAAGSMDTKMFRNSIRGQATGGDSATGSNAWTVRFDKYNQLLLRSALAAVNTIDIRDSDGISGTNKVGDVTTKKIHLQTAGGTPVEVTVYGTEAQPFITNVYAQTDTVTKVNGKVNPKGFIAIELFNPYPFDLKLSQYQLAVLDRRPAPTGKMTLAAITNATAGLAGITIKAGGFAILHNLQNGGADAANYIPKSFNNGNTTTFPGTAADYHKIKDLTQVLDGGAAPGTGGELILMRSHRGVAATGGKAPDGTWDESKIEDWVPVDAFDFTGLSLVNNTKAHVWHYSRIASTATTDAWKCVYPGIYQFAAAGEPRLKDTQHAGSWDPNKGEADPWEPAGDPKTKGNFFDKTKTSAQATVTNPYPGIQLNNFDWGNKAKAAGANKFPFGGFARVGDVLQVPFIGSYRVRLVGATTTLMDLTPVTMDSMFADDGKTNDDAVEQVGRFCPITLPAQNIDDLNPFGTYDRTLYPPIAGHTVPDWRYRWATKIFDEFTVIANPNDDYYPNIDPWRDPALGAAPGAAKYPGTTPTAKPNSSAAANAPNALNEEGASVEGLVNINTASWRVLSALQMIPNTKGGNTVYSGSANPYGLTNNDMLAKFIVYFRDVDDGMYVDANKNHQPHPHGPFQSLAELNAVFDPSSWNAGSSSYDRTFANALGILKGVPTSGIDASWGNHASGSEGPTLNHMVDNDFERQFLMVNRISNLVTTRSDSFTCYVMVQGWRNVNTRLPELVVQKRAAFIIDRSHSAPTASSYSVTTVETR